MDFTLSQSQTSKWEAFFFNCAHLHTVIHQHLHFPGNDSTSTTANCGDCTEPSLCAGRPCKAHYIIVPFHYDPEYGQWHEANMYEKCAQQHNIGGSLVEFCDRSYVNYGNISSRSIPNSFAASGKKCERMSRMYALPLQIWLTYFNNKWNAARNCLGLFVFSCFLPLWFSTRCYG